eukprot:s153_g45.t1
MIQPKSSRLLSFSVEAALLSDADAAPAPAPAPAPRPKSLTRRESPLAAAARRAREAMARKAAPKEKDPVKVQDGPVKARESPVKAREGPIKAKDSPVKARPKEGPVKTKEAKEGLKAKAVPKTVARTTPYAARSLIERPKVESKVLEKKLGKSETSETSAGSTPKCVLFEDTSNKMTDRVERAEILEAAQVLRKEAQDLGQALRQWVAEAEAEAEDAKERISSVAISEGTRRSNVDHDEASEVQLVMDGAEARPNSPVLSDPKLEAHVGRQRLEHECERLDADLQRVAGEWHRLWSERQRAIEALTDTERSRFSAPPVPLPLPARATLGTLPPNPVAQAPFPAARATVPALHQARSVARTPSPIEQSLACMAYYNRIS